MHCRIFRERIRNKGVESGRIQWLGKYYPKHGRPEEEMNEFSRRFLGVKRMSIEEIN